MLRYAKARDEPLVVSGRALDEAPEAQRRDGAARTSPAGGFGTAALLASAGGSQLLLAHGGAGQLVLLESKMVYTRDEAAAGESPLGGASSWMRNPLFLGIILGVTVWQGSMFMKGKGGGGDEFDPAMFGRGGGRGLPPGMGGMGGMPGVGGGMGRMGGAGGGRIEDISGQ
jgi:hypothetical protein